jgi:acyl-CoA reductase-like NAD-dependent aldehyde dehydrogenase
MTPVRDLAEGLRLAGEAGPGFGGSIYTRDVPGACALARLRAGAFRINDPPRPGTAGPFSGLRQREIHQALRAAPQGRSTDRSAPEIEAASVMERKPWWFPYADRVTAASAESA